MKALEQEIFAIYFLLLCQALSYNTRSATNKNVFLNSFRINFGQSSITLMEFNSGIKSSYHSNCTRFIGLKKKIKNCFRKDQVKYFQSA